MKLKKQGTKDTQILLDHDRGYLFFCHATELGSQSEEVSKRFLQTMRDFLIHDSGDEERTMPFEWDQKLSREENFLKNAIFCAHLELFEKNQNQAMESQIGMHAMILYFEDSKVSYALCGGVDLFLGEDKIHHAKTFQRAGVVLSEAKISLPEEYLGMKEIPKIETGQIRVQDSQRVIFLESQKKSINFSNLNEELRNFRYYGEFLIN